VIVYRIAKSKYIKDLSGYGSYLFGGRWTLQGIHALYTASSRSLAYLEFLVHQLDRDTWPTNIEISSLDVAAHEEIIQPNVEELPHNWHDLEYHADIQVLGGNYFRNGQLGLIVPSAIVPDETNLILNPQHPDYGEVVTIRSVESLRLDERFSRKI